MKNKNFIENIPGMASSFISCKTCKKGKRSRMYSQFTRKSTHTDFYHKTKCEMQYSDPSVLDKWEIEYVVVNMPMLLLKRPQQFIELVKFASDRDLAVLNIDSVKHVV